MYWHECETCTKEFRSWNAARQHMNDTNHWAPRYPCETCDDEFSDEEDADQHMEDLGHYADRYCRDCDRYFQSPSNLRQHMKSRTHRGVTIACPFCRDCYVTVAGLAHHLETGTCVEAPQLNRQSLHRIIRQRDPHGIITEKHLTYSSSTWSVGEEVQDEYTGFWNCHLCSFQARSAHSLETHLNSPRHQRKVYHCPNGKCPKEFSALAGLLNHLESESCQYMKFDKVQKQAQQVFTSKRAITLG